jgi:polysaccharide export outer membrane protein
LSFPPQTNIRLTVVQWLSTKGVYERWDALGGDFKVSDNGSVSLPIIGTIPVGKLDEAGLSAEIAERLKTKIGLVEKPEITVSIIDYPPVYVVGDVKTPGEYRFHTGLTVLQSLAMSGGTFRADGNAGVADRTGVVGLLRGLDNSILRGEIKISRLQAEMAGEKQIRFAPHPGDDSAEAMTIFKQEQAIFSARANLLQRQSKSYAELRDLLKAEISNLEKKADGADADIKSVENELRNVKSMVVKGIALPSKQSDLERMLRSYYAGRLDLTTATMRARQGIAEASRNIEGLYDRQRADVASELQVEQANLDQLELKRETTQKQLLETLSQAQDLEKPGDTSALVFTIDRRVDDSIQQLAASEATALQPGDVVRVTRKPAEMPDESVQATTPRATSDLQSGISQ